MKKNSLSLAAVALVFATAAYAQNGNQLAIKGHLTDVVDTIVIEGVNYGEYRTFPIAKVVAKDGRFEYTATIESPKMLMLYRPFAQQKGQKMIKAITVPAIPGETIDLEGTTGECKVTGSTFYVQYAPVHEIFKQYEREIVKATEEYYEMAADPQQKDKAKEQYQSSDDKARKTLNESLFAYAKQHPNEEAIVTAAYKVNGEQLDSFLKLLSPEVANGRMKPIIDASVNRHKAELAMEEAKKKVAPGNPAPDFTLNDINGKPFSLSSLRGKYVVLDFWGAWCGWCIKGMPEMKKYYEKYRGKFEIVGVDCNDKEDKWKAAVEKHELPWIHVKSEQQDATPQKYAVTGYPTKVVIDPEGKIAKVVVGEDPEFYNYLDTLFGK
ncbi:MAG: TlpA family protein disulfide reductase [Prevotella sp.]